MNRLSRRDFLKAAGVAALTYGTGVQCLARSGQERRPNILFILADDLGFIDSTPYGSKYYETPNLERLARRGMLFTNAYAASPLCSPTRASIMTGKYPARLRITTPACHLPPLDPEKPLLAAKAPAHQKMVTPQSRRYLPLAEYTIAEAFEDGGYSTGFIGKWHLGLDKKYWPAAQGFEYDLGAPNPGPPSYFSPYRFKTIPDGPKGEYITDRVTEETLKYLEGHKERPFMLCVWHFAVHAPFQAKEEITKRYRSKRDPRGRQDCAVMASMIQSLDESVGRILDKLDELAIGNDTIVIFMSDNGGNMYNEVEGTTPTNNYPLRGGKGNIYDGGTREPCIIVWPGVVEPHSRCDQVISSVDFYPTMLEMAGISKRADHLVDGVSIVPLLKGREELSREAIFCHFPHYVPATKNLPSTYVRKGQWKLIRFYGEGPDRTNSYELYNLKDDIGERKNLADQMPEKVRDLDALIERFLSETDALVPIKNPAYRAPAGGWQPSNQCELEMENGILRIRSTGTDPFIRTSDVPIVNGPMVLELRMRSQIGGQGYVFWSDAKRPGFGPEQRVGFSPIHDDKWREYQVEFSSKGILKGLRIDPGNTEGAVEVDWVRLRRKHGEVLKDWDMGDAS